MDHALRFEPSGDYSDLNRCISVFPAVGSVVTVKSITVAEMATSSTGPAPLSSLAQK